MQFHTVRFGDLNAAANKLDLAPKLIERLHSLGGNPHINAAFPVFFCLEEGGRVACHFVSFPDQVRISGKVTPWAWSGDLFTHPDHRGKGLASRLVAEQTRELHEAGYVWGGVFSTDAALAIYRKLGFKLPGFAARLLIVNHASPLIKGLGASNLGSCTGDLVFRMLERARLLAFRRGPPGPNSRYQLHADLSDAPGVGARNAGSSISFDESSAMLQWKLSARGIDKTISFSNGMNDLGSFFVRSRVVQQHWRGRQFQLRLMTIMHTLSAINDPAFADHVVWASVDMLRRDGADALEIITSSPAMIYAARRRGMFRAGRGMSFTYYAPPNLLWPEPSLADWPLTHYCGDAFSFG
jgi:GNAT superfamily N-acetyltransferase